MYESAAVFHMTTNRFILYMEFPLIEVCTWIHRTQAHSNQIRNELRSNFCFIYSPIKTKYKLKLKLNEKYILFFLSFFIIFDHFEVS